VRDAGLEENTLFFFSSDNGGATYTRATTNAPLKGGKLSHFEGGINVPFLMSWKGTIPPNTVYRHPVSTLDVFPTIAANIHSALPHDRPYDGVDLVAKVLKQEPAHEALFWRSIGSWSSANGAARSGYTTWPTTNRKRRISPRRTLNS
jgi:arylsulfatase A-like enzyme